MQEELRQENLSWQHELHQLRYGNPYYLTLFFQFFLNEIIIDLWEIAKIVQRAFMYPSSSLPSLQYNFKTGKLILVQFRDLMQISHQFDIHSSMYIVLCNFIICVDSCNYHYNKVYSCPIITNMSFVLLVYSHTFPLPPIPISLTFGNH